MTQQDWIKILEKDDMTDWEWYARWLRDEQENESKARAVEWMIFQDKEPYYHRGSKSFDWYALGKYNGMYTEQCQIDQKIHDHIMGYKDNFIGAYTGFFPSDWKGFDTKLAAKLALVDAYELYLQNNTELDAAPGE